MTNLYEQLGVDRSADAATISRAYRRLALQYHPDRNPDGEEMFKRLAKAHEVLTNEQLRGIYDATGRLPDDAPGKNDETDEERQCRRAHEMRAEVEHFYETYAGTDTERADLAKAYGACKGNFKTLIDEHAIFENKPGELRRIYDALCGLIAAGTLVETKAWRGTTTDQRLAALEKRYSSEAKAAKKQLAELFADRETNTTHEEKRAAARKAPGGGQLSLANMLQARAQERVAEWDSMADALAAKYGAGKKTAKARRA